jgi:hypothetical protein
MAGKPVAILISLPSGSSDEVMDERQNFLNLRAEYRAAVMGQFFLDRWHALGRSLGHGLLRRSFVFPRCIAI